MSSDVSTQYKHIHSICIILITNKTTESFVKNSKYKYKTVFKPTNIL